MIGQKSLEIDSFNVYSSYNIFLILNMTNFVIFVLGEKNRSTETSFGCIINKGIFRGRIFK